MAKKIIALFDYFMRIGKKLSDDNVNAFSAQAAFFFFVSIFPFIMLLLSLLQFFPFSMEDLINAAEAVIPKGINKFIVPTIEEIYQRGTPALISVTAVTTIWSASTGVNAVSRGLTKIADNENTESWFKLRLQSILYMLGLIIVLILSLGFFVFGTVFITEIRQHLPHLPIYRFLSTGIRTLSGICVLSLIFDLIYIFAPKRPGKFLNELPGAVFSAIGWTGFSYLYSFYINNITNFSVYGSLTVVVFFLIWMYGCFYMLFVGAEINCYLQGVRAKDDIHNLLDELKS